MITIKKFYNGMTDAVFKAIFCKEENKDLLKRLIETSLQKEVEIIQINFNVNDKETNPPFLQLSMRDIKYPEIDLIDNFKVYVFI